MKICTKCGKEKIRRSNKWICRDCQIAYQKQYYLDNQRREIDKRLERKNRILKQNQELLSKIKSDPCSDCGNTFPPIAMDFDHVRGIKVMDIAKMVTRGYSIQTIMAEIEKCELVCAVCHRIRTWQRHQYNASLV